MAFQSTIRQFPTDAFPGDFVLDGPVRSQPVILQSADATQNVIGRAVTLVAGTDGAAVAGGTGVFGGILTNSKVYASIGGTTGPLSPTLTLPNGLAGVQATTMAAGICVLTTTTANVGDQVCYKTTTGEIGAAPGGTPPGGYTVIPGAYFIRNNITTANTPAFIELLNS